MRRNFFLTAITILTASTAANAGVITVGATAGQSRTSATAYTAVATDENLVFTVSKAAAPETRTVLEFDVTGIPVGATIDSVILNLTADTSIGTSTQIELHHFLGNGTIEPGDFTAINGSPVTHNTNVSLVAPTVNSIDVTSMFSTGTNFAGFRISQNTDPGTFNFLGLGLGANAPQLTVNFTAIPEPSSVWLLGFAFVGTAGFVRYRRRNQAESDTTTT